MTADERLALARSIDHTLLTPEATKQQIEQLCSVAHEYNFASVCVLPYHVHTATVALEESSVAVCTVVGFPLGATYGLVKAHEAREAIARGASEIDMVMNISALKNKEYQDVLFDIEEVVEVAHSLGALVKVIIETCMLTEDEKKKACELVTIAQADFVKTSTGFSNGGATLDDVRLLRSSVGPFVRVKASGGIRDTTTAVAMIAAGANRLGTSAGREILLGSM